ncbi:MAG: 16S rRNA (guanine(966)-N(2))-methyltransferase RsmD [Deltaproteobacteria bacterium]|nr:16S rRNA (guanine(966)-N(2))-methyltransferase RsmD [Deltaproteobacteria bacterium]
MRIIGGRAKGRRFGLPRGCRIRPTSDGIKEALFNLLGPVAEKAFIDLYAGSGSIGIEALSRGAARVVFVEKNPALVRAIGENLRGCGFGDPCDILALDVRQGIRLLENRRETFDILFADPPYEKGLIEDTVRLIGEGRLIAEGGLAVMQHSIREGIVDSGCFELSDQRCYGDTLLSFLKFNGGETRNL